MDQVAGRMWSARGSSPTTARSALHFSGSGKGIRYPVFAKCHSKRSFLPWSASVDRDVTALPLSAPGAEAALLTAVHDNRVKAVVAISPSHVVWGNIGPGWDGQVWPQRSSWTLGGTALLFVASDPYWRRQMRDGMISYRSLFEQSLRRFAPEADAATIPVEQISADVLLVAGGDDALWPSEASARAIVARRAESSKATSLVVNPNAGHRVLLPGENKPRSSLHAHGGSDEADAALGRAAWGEIKRMLQLGREHSPDTLR